MSEGSEDYHNLFYCNSISSRDSRSIYLIKGFETMGIGIIKLFKLSLPVVVIAIVRSTIILDSSRDSNNWRWDSSNSSSTCCS